MGLKCVLVRISSSRNQILLVTAEEEGRFLSALEECGEESEVVVSAMISNDQPMAEREICEIKRLFDGAKTLVVTSSQAASNSIQVAEVACEAHLLGVRVISLETALLELDPSIPAHSGELVHRLATDGTHQSLAIRLYATIKDALEPMLGAILLICLSPLVLLVALAVKLTSPGPVFYRQTRLGHRRQLFDIIKFRSMRIDAEKDGPMWAAASRSDSRLTPIGGFLRATHLDEIPQIWNVVRGELSFVGPRPERPVFCQELEEKIPLFRFRTLVKPGITGWAQIRAGYANSIDDSKRKLEFDLYYILKHSPVLDLRIVLDTVAILFSGGSEGRKRERSVEARPGLARQRAVLPAAVRRPVAVVDGSSVREQSAVAHIEIS